MFVYAENWDIAGILKTERSSNYAGEYCEFVAAIEREKNL